MYSPGTSWRETPMNDLQNHPGKIPALELERYRDAEWALRDPEVQSRYKGQWVVAYERKIIAHGHDADTVAAEAGHVATGFSHRLVYCSDDNADAWLAQTSDGSLNFTDA